ncbi:MAG: RDD family protein [Sporichthyaceae bacterium]
MTDGPQPPYGQPYYPYGPPQYPYGFPTVAQPGYPYPPPVPSGLPPGLEPGGMGERFLARLIDGLLALGAGLLVAGLVIGVFGLANGSVSPEIAIGGALLGYLVWMAGGLLYPIAMLAKNGQTIGKRYAGLREIPMPDPSWQWNYPPDPKHWIVPLGWGKAAARELIYACVPFSALSPFFDDRTRRGWHDQWTDLVVVVDRPTAPPHAAR